MSARVGAPVSLTCESDGLVLSSCFWARTTEAERKVVEVTEDTGDHPMDGITPLAYKLTDGVCSIWIRALQEEHYGLWSCTMVATEGRILHGMVELKGKTT